MTPFGTDRGIDGAFSLARSLHFRDDKTGKLLYVYFVLVLEYLETSFRAVFGLAVADKVLVLTSYRQL